MKLIDRSIVGSPWVRLPPSSRPFISRPPVVSKRAGVIAATTGDVTEQARRPRSGPVGQENLMAKVLRTAAQDTGVPGAQVGFLDPENTADIEATAHLLAQEFLQREPMTAKLADENESIGTIMRHFASGYAADVAKHGLTPIARNSDGKIIALLMAEPYDAEAEAPPIPELAPVFAVLGNLTEKFADFRAQQGELYQRPLLHLAMAAADSAEGTPGLTSALLRALVTKVKIEARLNPQRAYSYMVAEATSNGSQGTLRFFFKFKKAAEEFYRDHPRFADLSRPKSAVMMVKSINDADSYPVPDVVRRPHSTLTRSLNLALEEAPDSPLLDALRALPVSRSQALVGALTAARSRCTRFRPHFDAVYDCGVLRVMRLAADAGLPMFDNGILVPAMNAGNWPYHFKKQELQVVQSVAGQAGVPQDSTVHGYVCDRGEANRHGIRVLKNHLQSKDHTVLPVVVVSTAAHPSVALAAEAYGLPCVQIGVGSDGAMQASALQAALAEAPLDDPSRPIILSCSLGAENAAFDDLAMLPDLLRGHARQTLVHVDASRSFDFLERDGKGQLLAFTLDPQQAHLRPCVHALTAGGLSTHASQYVTTVYCSDLQSDGGMQVPYLRGTDTTVSGSRPATAGLSAYLLARRFSAPAKQAMARRADEVADYLRPLAAHWGLNCVHHPGSLDIALVGQRVRHVSLFTRLAMGLRVHEDALVLTVQPSITNDNVKELVGALAIDLRAGVPANFWNQDAIRTDFKFSRWRVAKGLRSALQSEVAILRQRDPRPAGYPGNHATLEVLGPVLRPFLSLPIPDDLVREMSGEIISRRMKELGAPSDDRRYAGSITTGSTSSIHSGLINALRTFPNAAVRVYISAGAHYSGVKLCKDHAALASRYRIVATDSLGRMDPAAFVLQLQQDRLSEPDMRCILLATHGTTFTGAVDDVSALLSAAGTQQLAVDYVHVDGALDLGSSLAPYRLAKPGDKPQREGAEAVRIQSVSVSNHKFPGLKVSGIHLAALPPGHDALPVTGDVVDPTATLQLWAYEKLMDADAVGQLHKTCVSNAEHMRKLLLATGEPAQGAPGSLTTVIDRPSNLLTNRFLLAPEGDKAHIVAMPHLRREDLEMLVDALVAQRGQNQTVTRLLNERLRPFALRGEIVDTRLPDSTARELSALLLPEATDQEAREFCGSLSTAFEDGDSLAALARDSNGRLIAAALLKRADKAWLDYQSGSNPERLSSERQKFVQEQLSDAVRSLDISALNAYTPTGGKQ